MTRAVILLSVGVLLAFAAASAQAQTCRETLGPQRATALADECLDMSEATRPPCNIENPCDMIRDEIKRGCDMLDEKDRPAYCKPYLAGADFVPPPPAHITKPGFDCAKANTPVEHAICSDDGLAAADREMSKAFGAALAKTSDAARLRASQRAFIAERQHCADPEPGHSVAEIIDFCVLDLTTSRIDELTDGTASDEGRWSVFDWDEDSGRICSLRFGHDTFDLLWLDYQHAGGDRLDTLHFDEQDLGGPPILRAGDSVGFDVDGTSFPATVQTLKEMDDEWPAIVAAVPRDALMHALTNGHMLRVKRNGKVIFRAPLSSFAAADAEGRKDCKIP